LTGLDDRGELIASPADLKFRRYCVAKSWEAFLREGR